VQEYAHLFLTEKAEKSINKGEPPNKSLFVGRTKFGIIVHELRNEGLIDPQVHQRYTMLSQWLHGTSQGMGIVFNYDGKRLSKDKDTCRSLGADAIIIGIRSLYPSLDLFNNHFKLNFHDRIIDFHGNFSGLLMELRSKGLF
jgi:hypothetical protein